MRRVCKFNKTLNYFFQFDKSLHSALLLLRVYAFPVPKKLDVYNSTLSISSFVIFIEAVIVCCVEFNVEDVVITFPEIK